MVRATRQFLACTTLAGALCLLWTSGGPGPEVGGAEGVPAATPADPPAVAAGATDRASVAGTGESSALVRELTSDLVALANRPGDWGVVAISLTGGDTLVNLGGELPMAPASNMKLFTSAAALHHLGPEFRFPTWLLADGPVEDGVLKGDLLLYGTGDPTLGLRNPDRPEAAIAHFLDALQALGISAIEGDVLGDGTYFRGDPRRPSWNPDDLNDWFAAPVSALSFNENMVSLQIRARGASGGPPQVVTHPRTTGLPISNRARVVPGRPGTPLSVLRIDPDAPIEIRGEMGSGSGDVWRAMSVSEPQTYAAAVLLEAMESAGIRVAGTARATDARDLDFEEWQENPGGSAVTGRDWAGWEAGGGSGLRVLSVHHSAPLPDLLHMVNHRSHNLFAEVLLKALGRQVVGDPSFEGGREALTRYLVEVVGIDPDEIHVEDGSGLSRLNRASPRALVRVLEHMAHDPHAELFRASLPEAGTRQGLSRMHRTPAAGNLRAKTGTIHRVSALSGVVTTAGGEEVLFSIIANDVPSPWAAKRVEDEMGARLAAFSRPGSSGPDTGPLPGVPAQARGSRTVDER